MEERYRKLLEIPTDRLEALNQVLLDPDSKIMRLFLDVVSKYGTPDEINRKHRESRKLANLLEKARVANPDHLKDLNWLQEQSKAGGFVSVGDYRRRVLGPAADRRKFADDYAVTLEVSALQYFPWVRETVERALQEQTLVPGRFISVRKMK